MRKDLLLETVIASIESSKNLKLLFMLALKHYREQVGDLVSLLIVKLGPEYRSQELGIGLKFIKEFAGRGSNASNLYIKYGNYSKVVFKKYSSRPRIGIGHYMKTMRLVQQTHSKQQKLQILRDLQVQLTPKECEFMMLWLQGSIRIQCAREQILAKLSGACCGVAGIDPKYEKQILNLFDLCVDYELVIDNLIKSLYQRDRLINLLSNPQVINGIPVRPMQPVKLFQRKPPSFNQKTHIVQLKYDGFRSQIHISKDGSVTIYSKRSNNITFDFPEICEVSKKYVLRDCILDCEIVPIDRSNDRLLPFQLMGRKHRHQNYELCIFVFDIIMFKGQSLVTRPLHERLLFIKKAVLTRKQYIEEAEQVEQAALDKMMAYSSKERCEGIVIKDVNGTYIPKKNISWIAVKQGLGETFDLVVVGVKYGSNRFAGLFSSFLVASVNQKTGKFDPICKVGIGFNKQQLVEITKLLKKYIIRIPDDRLDRNQLLTKEQYSLDHWTTLKLVVEVEAQEITKSPKYKQVSLRSPRFKRFRFDKQPDESTSSQQLIKLGQKGQSPLISQARLI